MSVAAILGMWPGPFEQTFVPASLGVSIWNLSLIGPVVSEEKMFENVDGQTDDGLTDAGVTGILLAHPLAFSSGELISGISNINNFDTQVGGGKINWPGQLTPHPCN